MPFPKLLNKMLHLCIALGLCLIYLRYVERRSLFYPSKEIEILPQEAGLEFETADLITADKLKINGWFIPAKGARYTILFCHGNAGNISHRLEKLRFFNQLGCSVFIFDYRGYGLSQGRPQEKGFYLDAQAAYDYLLSKGITAAQIIGYGESLGGAVIINLAYRNKIRALILESTFSSIKDMAKRTFPLIPYWVFSSRFDSLAKIKSITAPKLIIHSINDEIVPYELGRKLYEAAAPAKEMLAVYGGHNSCFYEAEGLFKRKINEFIGGL